MGAMRARLERCYRVEAAHRLPRVPAGHPCSRLHGHAYAIWVAVEGQVHDDTGWLIDFHDMDRICDPIVRELDHRCLNDVPGLENPTVEQIARWLWLRLGDRLQLAEIRIEETADAVCIYRGE